MFALVFKIYPWEFPLASNDWTIDSWKSRLEIDLYRYIKLFGSQHESEIWFFSSSLYGTIFAVGSEWILESICKRIILALLKFLSVICLAIYFIIFILSRTRQEYLFFHPVFIGPVVKLNIKLVDYLVFEFQMISDCNFRLFEKFFNIFETKVFKILCIFWKVQVGTDSTFSTFFKKQSFILKSRIVSLPMPCLDVWKRTRSEFTNNPKSIAIVSVRQAFRLGK